MLKRKGEIRHKLITFEYGIKAIEVKKPDSKDPDSGLFF
jgi:hypothetical protein